MPLREIVLFNEKFNAHSLKKYSSPKSVKSSDVFTLWSPIKKLNAGVKE